MSQSVGFPEWIEVVLDKNNSSWVLHASKIVFENSHQDGKVKALILCKRMFYYWEDYKEFSNENSYYTDFFRTDSDEDRCTDCRGILGI